MKKTPEKRTISVKKGDVVWVALCEGGSLAEYHDDPVAYCSAIRLNLEGLPDRDQLLLFWEDNVGTIEVLCKALPTLRTEGEQHYADVLGDIYSMRLQALTDDKGSVIVSPDERPVELSDQLSNSGAVSDTVVPISTQRRLRDKSPLEFVATQSCLVCDGAPSQAHHICCAQPRARGMKVGHEWTVPIRLTHHRALHDAGNEADWWWSSPKEPVHPYS